MRREILITRRLNPLHPTLSLDSLIRVALALLEHPAGQRAAIKERRP